jgi:hypothetical protein
VFRSLAGLLAEHVDEYHGIRVYSVNNSPTYVFIYNPEFVAACPY